MTDHTPPEPVENEPVKPKPDKPKKLSVYLTWCYGMKVCVCFWVLLTVACLPLYAVMTLISLAEGGGDPMDSKIGGVVGTVFGVIMVPFLVGHLYRQSRAWFDLDKVDMSIEEAFRPKV